MLRRYWHPIAVAAEVDSENVPAQRVDGGGPGDGADVARREQEPCRRRHGDATDAETLAVPRGSALRYLELGDFTRRGAGMALGLPWLEAMTSAAPAAASTAKPKRR